MAVVEVALIFLLLFVFAGSPPPGDDEAHYLGKAKQFWNPQWLEGDFFLETPDAHVVFNWTVGWPTLFVSLDAAVWIGRTAAWLLLAVAWQRLSYALVPRPLMSLLTMGWFLVFQQYGTAAREWIVGGVEAKCFAWALVVLALEQLVRADQEGGRVSRGESWESTGEFWRWNCVWLLLGLAAAFHVLVGGWAVLAALMTWLATKRRPTLISMLPTLIAGGLVSLLGVWPALRLSAGADPEIVSEAHRIYVFERLNHHLVLHDFTWKYRLQFLGVLCAWLATSWATRKVTRGPGLRKFILASLVIAIIGIAIDQATLTRPDLAALLLRFYWFRLADMMVPIGLALGLADVWEMISVRMGTWSRVRRVAAHCLFAALCLVPMTVIGWLAVLHLYDRRSGSEIQAKMSQEDVGLWREACAWIEQQTPANSRFLTPPLYQCFRWHAERSEVATWKDIPQSAADIVEWYERNRATQSWWAELRRSGYTPGVERRLRQLADRYDVQYIIVPRALTSKPLGLTPLFSNASGADDEAARGFTVYWISPSE
jgi:hypothetical protein